MPVKTKMKEMKMCNWIKRNFIVISLILGLSVSHIVNASAPELDDFSFTAELSPAKTSLRQINLPVDVYSKMYRNDLGDLRIFSGEGQLVPHQISRAENLISTQIQNLTFYPFNKEQASNKDNINIEINQSTGRKQLKINQSLNFMDDKNSIEYQYIIENAQFDLGKSQKQNNYPALCKMKLYWKQSIPSLILGLKLEGSSDLQRWNSLSSILNISRLNYADSQLVRDEIEFRCTSEPFLRLTWVKQEDEQDNKVTLTSIQGFYTQTDANQIQWKQFSEPRYNDDGHWLFESDVVSPIVKMEFKAPQTGLFYKGALFSRDNKEQKWRYRQQITQYSLNLGDSELQSNPFVLSGVNDRYWKFEPSIETKFTATQLPEINAAWLTNKVLFIAQGSEPFKLAFGNPNIAPAKASNLNSLIKSLQQSSSTVDIVTLNNIVDGEKSFSRDGQTNWKKMALWCVLLLGTLMMAVMAFRLFRQMGEANKGHPENEITQNKENE